MKVKIFNRGQGWYIVGNNYKDKTDKAYINLFFPQHTEPFIDMAGKDWVSTDIDILEGKFTSYKNKAGLTIFKYVNVSNGDVENFSGNFGGDPIKVNDEVITEDELPFY